MRSRSKDAIGRYREGDKTDERLSLSDTTDDG